MSLNNIKKAKFLSRINFKRYHLACAANASTVITQLLVVISYFCQHGLFQRREPVFSYNLKRIIQLYACSLPKDKVIYLLYLTSFKSLISFSAKEKTVRFWGRQTGAVRSEVIIFPCSNRVYKIKIQWWNVCLIKIPMFLFRQHLHNTHKGTIIKAFWNHQNYFCLFHEGKTNFYTSEKNLLILKCRTEV